MASKSSLPEEDFSCPVCCDIFKDPVILSCSHSFCKDCLQESWGDNLLKLLQECPVCKERHYADPPRNLALKNLCEAFLQERSRRTSTEPEVLALKNLCEAFVHERSQRTSTEPEVLCGLHAEKFKLFCIKCQLPVCVVCRDSEKHSKHRFKPIDEAARYYKKKVKKSLNDLQEKLELFNKRKTNCDQTAAHIKIQTRRTEMQMKEQFKKLHLFLQEEEEARLAELREEEQQKSQMMKEKIEGLNREMTIISDTIRAVEEQLRAEHVPLLQNSKSTMRRIIFQLKLQYPLPWAVPSGPSGALMDEAKHLHNLTFKVWDKMKDIVSYTPVILDPNTAYPGLILSDDLTSVRYGDKQDLPHNPERFECRARVLGSEGFNSGTHSWDIEVADNIAWRLGVLTESYQRKGDGGGNIWCISFFQGEYIAESGSDGTVLSVQRNPQRVRVRLDWSKKLSFSDADTNTPLHTFTRTSTDTLYPFIGNAHTVPLKILPSTVSVKLGHHSYT